MNAIDKAIAYVSPARALERQKARVALSRHEAAYPTQKRRFYGSARERSGPSQRDTRERQSLAEEADQLKKNQAIVKYAVRDFQMHVTPRGWVPATGDPQLDEVIKDEVSRFLKTGDFNGRRHVLDLFSLGALMQIIQGDMGLAIVNDEGQMKLQAIRKSRIGGPVNASLKHTPGRTRLKKKLEEQGRYHQGVEHDAKGRLTRYWIYRREKTTGMIESEAWVFDKTFRKENFLLFEDPLDIDEERGATELAQAIDPLKDHAETMDAMQQKVKWMSKKMGYWKSPAEDIPDNPMEVKTTECPGDDKSGNGVHTIDMGDGLEISGISNDYEFDLMNDDIPNASFAPFMDCLNAAVPNALHLPASWLGVKGKSLQGTDVRADVGKAQAEFERKRGLHERNVYLPVIEAFLASRHEVGAFGTANLSDVLKGHWIYGKSLTVDEGHRSGRLINEAKMGWQNDSDIAAAYGKDPEVMRKGRVAQVDQLIQDALTLAKKHDVTPEFAVRLLRDQNLGNPGTVEDAENTPPETQE